MLMNQLKEMLNKLQPVTTQNIHEIVSVSSVVRVSKGNNINGENDMLFGSSILMNGCARVYSINENGRECSNFFLGEGDFFGDIYMVRNEMSGGVQALTECEFLLMPQKLIQHNLYLLGIKEKLMETSCIDAQKRISSLILDKPDTRYQHFIKSFASLLKHIPDYCIASYIGVSSVHLSRIKNQVASF